MKEHPEDKARREEAQREARTFGHAIAKKHYAALRGLLVTYGDDVAEKKLARLRELFWAEELPRAVKKATKESGT